MNDRLLKVILVDDHSLCRNGLTDLLQHRGGVFLAQGDQEYGGLFQAIFASRHLRPSNP